MKKLILLLFLVLTLPLAHAAIMDLSKQKISQIPKIPEKAKYALPITIEVKVLDTAEDFFITITKERTISITNKGKPDVIIYGSENNLKNLLAKELNKNELKTQINSFQVQPKSMKGSLGVSIAEKALNVKFQRPAVIKKENFIVRFFKKITGLFFFWK